MTAPVQAPFEIDTLPESLRELLPQPYAYYRPLVSEAALSKLRLHRARATIESDAACTAILRDAWGIEGFACWRWLAWDTEQFGFPAARLELLVAGGDYHESRGRKAVLIDLVDAQCSEGGVRHLTARVDAGDFASIHALEHAGFELIDGIQTFSLDLSKEPRRPPCGADVEVRPFRGSDLEQVLAIALSAYVYDRFHADAALSGEAADRVNQTWIENSCLGKAADTVLVGFSGDKVVGYVTCKIDAEAAAELGVSFGTIVMVATAPEAQGHGVARAATYAALDWFQSRDVRIVEVGTQLRNIPAGRLYETCGFRLVGASLTFRRVL